MSIDLIEDRKATDMKYSSHDNTSIEEKLD